MCLVIRRFFRTPTALAVWATSILALAQIPASEFSSYNDIASGPGTHANTTLYAPNATASGFMKDIDTGADTTVTLTVTASGVNYETNTGVPAIGTDADAVFGGFVDFSTGHPHSLALSGADVFTYHFSGMDSADRFEFAGTACRGNDPYTDRWTLVTITGADAFTAAHSTGIGIVTAGLPANQVAIWTGANHNPGQGFVVQWTDIDPGADGEFLVQSSQFSGATPGVGTGTASGSKGYGLSGIRLNLTDSFIVGQPSIANTSATEITNSIARVGGEVTDIGADIPAVTLYWGTEDAGGDAAGWDQSLALGAQDGSFDEFLSGLDPGTTYYFRSFAQNSAAGIWAKPTLSFETLALPPSIENVGVTNLFATSAEVGTNVTGTGGQPPVVTLFYGASDGGTTAGDWELSIDLGVQAGAASSTISGLVPNSTYYFRARAVNSGGTAWATSTVQFTTPQVFLPEIANLAATDVNAFSAVLRGVVTDAGADPPAVTIYYGQSDGGELTTAWDASVEIGKQSGAFSRPVSALVPESTYYFRALASNAAGDRWASPSLSFVTVAGTLTKKVLIIGIDGTMPSALAVADTPNLNALIANGCFSNRVVSHPVTHSAAAWSSFFTGVWGDKHGVNDPGNSFAGNQFASYPSFFKRLEDANPAFETVCLARWSPLTTIVPDADVRIAFGSDSAITTETVTRLTTTDPDVFYMILLDVDSTGHSSGWGPEVPNYVAAIETADGRVGQIISALTSRPTYAEEDWLVMALTDHGKHDDPDLEKSQITFHIVSGPSAARGIMWPAPSIVDAGAMVLTHMGVPIDPAWDLDARVEGFPLPPTAYGANLIFNGDAESNSATDDYTPNRGIAWWFDLGSVTLGNYDGDPAFPSVGDPGPPDRGDQFFLGGTANDSISQTIDLSDIANDIDGVGVNYMLSGWFGGAGSDDDLAVLSARFLDAQGSELGSDLVGGVTAADRGDLTGLLERSATAALPAGTRFVEFILNTTIATGMNDASADNLSFVIQPSAETPNPSLSFSVDGNSLLVDFGSRSDWLYTLERSEDFLTWIEIVASTAGTGGRLIFTDPDPPTNTAFYRVGYLRP